MATKYVTVTVEVEGKSVQKKIVEKYVDETLDSYLKRVDQCIVILWDKVSK